MSIAKAHLLLACVALGIGVTNATPAAAQVAPMGAHYGGRASDTGHQGLVNAVGDYRAEIPFDFPTPRGGLPLPVSLESGGFGVGAAGAGWDIPFSYVRVDTSFAGRRPSNQPGAPPQGRELVTLSLMGQRFEFVRTGSPDWVPREGGTLLTLRQPSPNQWWLADGDGRTYVFLEPHSRHDAAGSDDQPAVAPMSGAGFFLLDSITGPGGTKVQLGYDVANEQLPGGAGVLIDLASVAYDWHPSMTCPKHEIFFGYEVAPAPLAISVLGDHLRVRTRQLTTVDVTSSDDTCAPKTSLRTYSLGYTHDADTQLPRLQTVTMAGRGDAGAPLPIASFTYGSAIKGGVLSYQQAPAPVPWPVGVSPLDISSTVLDPSVHVPASGEHTYATWKTLTDVNGDGRADLVFANQGKLSVALNAPTAGGATTLNSAGTLGNGSFSSGSFEARSTTQPRFVSGGVHNREQIWRQAIDVNGDGRLDIIDAGETPGMWTVYLNTPSSLSSGVLWQRRAIPTAPIAAELQAHHHALDDPQHVPLGRRFTGVSHYENTCLRWDSTTQAWVDDPTGFYQPPILPTCSGIAGAISGPFGAEMTFTEWEMRDLNGDGFPDFVFNSSPAGFIPNLDMSKPAGPTTQSFIVSHTPGPVDGGANNILALFDVGGVGIDDNGASPLTPIFSSSVPMVTRTACGVGRWHSDGDSQASDCGFADINGDGFPERIATAAGTFHAFVGTGVGFSTVTLGVPPGFLGVAQQTSGHSLLCPTPASQASFGATMQVTLRDLTGDGIPDFVDRRTSPSLVWVGTGTGFTSTPIPIHVAGSSGFAISDDVEDCQASGSATRSGLFDLDGDGRPEVVTIANAGLNVFQLAGGSAPGVPEAGRIVSVDNGYGATTSITYQSAKLDTRTPHAVPFPEIVVSSVTTTGTKGLGGTLAPTRYAYGNASLVYDAYAGAYRFPGYQRTVSQQVNGVNIDGVQGLTSVTDAYGLDAFSSALSKSDRFARLARVGRVRDVFTLSTSNDPWAELALAPNDWRIIAIEHHEYAAKLYDPTEQFPPGYAMPDCFDVPYPYDYDASLGEMSPIASSVLCTAHGFAFDSLTDSWRGTSAGTTATTNVESRVHVRSVDDYGRATSVSYENDIHRSEDDVCVDTTYATTTGIYSHVLTAVSSRRTWGCSAKDPRTFAYETTAYDRMAMGTVSNGFPTGHTVERHVTDDGSLIDTVHMFDATYDAAGNLVSITTLREDGAARTTSFQYDSFGMVPKQTTVVAPGLPTMQTSTDYDYTTLIWKTATDVNKTQRGQEVDGFGRVTGTTVTPYGGSAGVLSTTAYLGFTGSDPDARHVVRTTFGDAVPKATADAGTGGMVSTVYLDELGRDRKTKVDLGADYAATGAVVLGLKTYDNLGRVVFEAEPYSSADDPTDDPTTVYGTSRFFNADGTPYCFVRGKGPLHRTEGTNEASEIYPTCFYHGYANNLETYGVSDAASNLPGSPQAGVLSLTTMTAIGRVVSRSTSQNGVRIDYAEYDSDKLGQPRDMVRYLTPDLAMNPVTTSWLYDSIGEMLEADLPESAPKQYDYSRWGEPIAVTWTDDVTWHRQITEFDALSRVTHREEWIAGVTDPETVYDYQYDVGTRVSGEVSPTFLLGRLAHAKTPTSNMYLSYDALGRVNARTYVDPNNVRYIEKSKTRADGSLVELDLYENDTGYAQERIDYGYDSASRLRGITYTDRSGSQSLYAATTIDPLGRVLNANYGATAYAAVYATTGRRLLKSTSLTSSLDSTKFLFGSHDPVGRERIRGEQHGAVFSAVGSTYDALGRLQRQSRLEGTSPTTSTKTFDRTYTYDALGNTLQIADGVGNDDTTLSYSQVDRDRLCAIGYGGSAPPATCNVLYDGVGNVVQEPTRTGARQLAYLASGQARSIDDATSHAYFLYDAFGDVEGMEVQTTGPGARSEWHHGLAHQMTETVGGVSSSFLSRDIPGPGGIIASRRGSSGPFVFAFGESRGNRVFADQTGAVVQSVSYQPYGEATSSGAPPGDALYSTEQWNGGDSLTALNLSQLGARIYDPVIGRFLQRDPLTIPRTASTTNAYAFAMNDPVNLSDSSGMDPDADSDFGLAIYDQFDWGDSDPSRGDWGGSDYGGGQSSSRGTPTRTAPTALDRLLGPGSSALAERDIRSNRWQRLVARASTPAGWPHWREQPGWFARHKAMIVAGLIAGIGVALLQPELVALGVEAGFVVEGTAASTVLVGAAEAGEADGNLPADLLNVVKSVNPLGWQESGPNCLNTAVTTERLLAQLEAGGVSAPMSAVPHFAGDIPDPHELLMESEFNPLERFFSGSDFLKSTGVEDIRTMMSAAGPDARGIVLGIRPGGVDIPGHFFNVINSKGDIYFLDGQSGGAAVTGVYNRFDLLITSAK